MIQELDRAQWTEIDIRTGDYHESGGAQSAQTALWQRNSDS